MQDTPCTYRISTKAIIRDDDGRVILGRQSDGEWELPGGGLEQGEDPRVGLAREIAEETGFTTDWISERPVAFWTSTEEVGHPSLKWFAFIAYEVKVSGEFKPHTDTNDAAQEVRYVTPEESATLNLHGNAKRYFGIAGQ